MRLTARNVQSVLEVYPEQLPDVLPKVFAGLLEPDQDPLVLQNYAAAIKQRFAEDERPDGQVKFDSFGEAAFEFGIVKTMLTLTKTTRPGMACTIAGYEALDSMWHLTRTANSTERRELLEQLLHHDVVEICLDKALNHPFCIHRQVGVNLLRCLASESFLGEYLTSAETSDVMVKMCQFILAGPEFFVKQMTNPDTTWQSVMCFGTLGAPTSKAARYAPRYYAMAQESAAWTIQGLLCRSPPPSPKFCAEVLSHNPELIDLLFQCALFPRPPWYPESQVDSISCESLAMLFRVPPETIPGISVTLENDFQASAEEDKEGVTDSLKLLTARPKWTEKIIAVWNKIDNEKIHELKKMHREVTSRYLAQSPPNQESFLATFEYRGTCRICMLRIITSLTHVADECKVNDSDLVSLLRIGHAASQNVKSMQQISTEQDSYTWVERTIELFRSPMLTVYTLEKVEPPTQIADESIMGPTTFIRLLTVLVQRDVLKDIHKWKKLPAGTSDTSSLAQVKQTAGTEEIQRTLPLIVKRVTARREVGHRRIRQSNEADHAGFAYTAAAELAAALIAFDNATDGKYESLIRGTRKELVLCLGNAAEMSLGMKRYRPALNYALGADLSSKDLPARDSVDDSIIAKNKRRVERARVGLVSRLA